MPSSRSRRGFALQSFISGPQSPSSHAVPTGRVPQPPSPASVPQAQQQGVNVLAPRPVTPLGQRQILGGTGPTHQATTSGNKFADLQTTLGGIKLSSGLFGGQRNAGQMLGQNAAGTDWGALLGYRGTQQGAVANALKALGITKPGGGLTGGGIFGTGSKYDDAWMKQMGLV